MKKDEAVQDAINLLESLSDFSDLINREDLLKFAENKSAENNSETKEISEKNEEISAEDEKVVAAIKPISKKKTEEN